jgi:L-seryl-tRNA(Ser) seleniumtransferase
MNLLSSLPSVEKILQSDTARALVDEFGRPLTTDAIRATLDSLRSELASQRRDVPPPLDAILLGTRRLLGDWTRESVQRVINATGVVLHTNLGRAPLSHAAIEAMSRVALGYSDLEYDLRTGRRGGRSPNVEKALTRLTGAEAAVVVNNNAAAVLLSLAALAARKRVAVARSQLVEIGGGFRMPDVMRQSRAKLVEVGTTNRIRLSDYQEAFSETALVLRAHRSNFKMIGFTEEPELSAIVDAAHGAEQIVVDDLGSGALLDTQAYGLAHEPMVQESVAAGADVVCFSGDKLLGGPQAGIILGRNSLIARIRGHPLARALRADKVALAGLSATLFHYLRNEAESEIPVWRMVSAPLVDLEARAHRWKAALGVGEVRRGESTLGGGSLPGEALPTYNLALSMGRAGDLMRRLRGQDPPIIARTERGKVLLDPRTVQFEEETALLSGVASALREVQ